MTREEAVRDLETAASESYIRFWWLTGAAQELDEKKDSEGLRSQTLGLVRMMLARNVRAGHLGETGGEFVAWPDQDPEAVVHRIEAEWDELGRDPTVNDICWFDRGDGNRSDK